MGLDDFRPRLTEEALHLLRDLFQATCGYHLRADLAFVAERRLTPRLESLGLTDFSAYYRYLRFDPRGPEELESAIDLLVPHETYFFREPAQLQCFSEELLPLLAKENAGTHLLRLWSAGCSTGEEAYTLAMLLSEHAALKGFDFDVLGTDLSKKTLSVARKAEYGQSSLRATNDERRARFFESLDPHRVRVRRHLRELVRFGQLNLIDAPAAASLIPQVDVIFCRNVLIYFDVETRKKVVQMAWERLRDGGYLLLGHSENLFSLSTRFELVQLEGDLVYRKPRA
jgi:chemotaxis protein methyltransferase CheR